MNRVFKLRNAIQAYAWGSRTAIPDLLGQPPAEEPQAELWMGAHPKAPSEVEVNGVWQPLDAFIARQPEHLLGADVLRTYGPRLPFLLKVLAAERPLSIQAHPDRQQAARGYARENAIGVPLEDPARNYRDKNHKPEILYALTRFAALRGFRPADETRERLRAAGLDVLLPALDEAPRAFLAAFLALDAERLATARSRLLSRLEVLDAASGAWIRQLEEHHPGDRGVLAPVFLRLVELEPGQALFTGPGVLHAYLGGVGIELMASSDNVLRCGLTRKHVDADELLGIARFDADDGLVEARQRGGVRHFPTPADDFLLSVIEVTPERPYARGVAAGVAAGDGALEADSDREVEGVGVQILLCTSGAGELRAPGAEPTPFARGDAFLVPASADGYRLSGEGTFFRAEVNRCPPAEAAADVATP